MKSILAALLMFITVLAGIMPVFAASDIPYHWLPSGANCSSSTNAKMNSQDVSGLNSASAMDGINDTDFTGKTLTSIGLYMCAFDSSGSPNFADSNSAQVGVFSAVTGNPIVIFGTVAFTSLPRLDPSLANNGVPAKFTVTGNYVMNKGDVIGVSFSSANTNHYVRDICGGTCDGAQLSNGGMRAVGCCAGGTFVLHGYSNAGDFVFTTQTKSTVAASPFVAVVFVLALYGTIKNDNPEVTKIAVSVVIGTGIIFLALIAAGL